MAVEGELTEEVASGQEASHIDRGNFSYFESLPESVLGALAKEALNRAFNSNGGIS